MNRIVLSIAATAALAAFTETKTIQLQVGPRTARWLPREA